MKLLRFTYDGKERIGAILSNQIVDLTRAYARMLAEAGEPSPHEMARAILPPNMNEFLSRGELALAQARETLHYVEKLRATGQMVPSEAGEKILFHDDEIDWLPPVTPSKYLAIGLNYADHIQETGKAAPDYPLLFNKLSSCVIGPDQPVILPSVSEKVDFEAELAVVIGKKAKRIKREDALDVIAGYTIANDVTARDLQKHDGQWTRGKGLDTFGPLGPFIVTKDELPDPGNVELRLWLNGVLMQHSNTRHLIFDIPSLIEYITEDITLYPGDVIATGTPAGVGVARKPPVYLQDGDRISIEIEGIGTLSNPVQRDVR